MYTCRAIAYAVVLPRSHIATSSDRLCAGGLHAHLASVFVAHMGIGPVQLIRYTISCRREKEEENHRRKIADEEARKRLDEVERNKREEEDRKKREAERQRKEEEVKSEIGIRDSRVSFSRYNRSET